MTLDWSLILQIAGVCLGLLYLYLEYKASILLWVVGLVMPLVHGILYYRSGLYADMAMNVYYILAGIYGWVVWRGAPRKKKHVQITRTPRSLVLPLAGCFIAVDALITFLLIRFTDSTVPYMDALTTALSIVAMWMLSRKYVEQWLLWLVVDAVCVGLYIYKGIPLTAGLYALYTALAYSGYRLWMNQIQD